MSKKEQKDTIFVGDSPEIQSLYGRLKRPERVIGVFCDTEDGDDPHPLRMGGVSEVVNYLEVNPSVHRVYCSMSDLEVDAVRSIQSACKVRAVKFCAVLPAINELDVSFVPMHVGRQLLLTPRPEPLALIHNIMVKRLFDLILSMLLLLTVFPVVYLFKYINVKRMHLGTAIRAQRVVGPNGRRFLRFTFRVPEGVNDGGWDALPQLFNVLTGRMSFVGPAPVPESHEGATLPSSRMERRYVKSGMTGWAQLLSSDGRSVLKDDIWYVEHWSLWLDLRILFRSLF